MYFIIYPILIILSIFLLAFIIFYIKTKRTFATVRTYDVNTGEEIRMVDYSFPLGSLNNLTKDVVCGEKTSFEDKLPWGIYELTKKYKGEKYFQGFFAFQHATLITDYEMAKKALQSIDTRPQTPINRFIFQNKGILFTNDMKLWKSHRNAALRGLMKPKLIKHYAEKVIVKNFIGTMKKWEKENSCEEIGEKFQVEVEEALGLFTFDVIGESALSSKFSSVLQDESKKNTKEFKDLSQFRHGFHTTIEGFQKYNNLPAFLYVFPFSLFLPNNVKIVGRNFDQMISYVKQLIRTRKDLGLGTSNDFLDQMLLKAEEVKDTDEEMLYDDEIMIRSILDIIAAGHETTAHTISWAILHLINTPDAMKKAIDEVDNAVNNTSENWELSALPYIDACVKESLRLTPTVPLTPRETQNKPVTIDNLYIPQHSMVVISNVAVGRDRGIYGDDADLFRPGRWLEKNGEKGLPNPLSFGAGKRLCLGESFARLEARVVLALILSRYSLALPKGVEICADGIFSKIAHFAVTMGPNKLDVEFTRRR